MSEEGAPPELERDYYTSVKEAGHKKSPSSSKSSSPSSSASSSPKRTKGSKLLKSQDQEQKHSSPLDDDSEELLSTLEDLEATKKLRVARVDRTGTFGGLTHEQYLSKPPDKPLPVLPPKRSTVQRSHTADELPESSSETDISPIKAKKPNEKPIPPERHRHGSDSNIEQTTSVWVPLSRKTHETRNSLNLATDYRSPDKKKPENKLLLSVQNRSFIRQQSHPVFSSYSRSAPNASSSIILNSGEEQENNEVLYKPGETVNKTITEGTVNGLIVALSTNDSVRDLTYVETFLLTHRYFIDSRELLTIICTRYHAATENNCKLRLINVLKKWLDTIWDDFRDAELFQLMIIFITEIEDEQSTSGLEKQWVKPLVKIIESRSGKPWSYWRGKEGFEDGGDGRNKFSSPYSRRNVVSSIEAPEPIIPVCGSSGGPPGVLSFLDIHPTEVARQLTLIDFEIFQQIQNKEYIKKAWTGDDKKELAPNIVAWIDRFNQTSFWVATVIILQQTQKARIKCIENFIVIMEEFLQLNNFNGVMEVFTALNMGSIHRLKATWKLVNPKYCAKLKEIEDLMSTGQNYSRYRKALSLVSTPVLPFQAVCLSDLVFIEETPDLTENGMINFHKMGLLAKVILNLHQYQAVPYALQKVSGVYDWLLKPTLILDEKELYLGSKNVEPPKEMSPGKQLGKGKVGPNSPLSSSMKINRK
eukprot:TRINITY_DN2216_c0_g1_i1.p1 TRINITY_DN2216_c0_g1~~TRINITY_DN2216_c0_g1_i1.p1  ORF type:complete len:702 (-),score=106.93 TRINITY_DN2216_c0_g1_i1:18-2123(-)